MIPKKFVSLDVGERRIGVAVADSTVKIAVPQTTIEVDGTELERIKKIVFLEGAELLVVGYPRNQQGEATKQTEYVQKFVAKLRDMDNFNTEITFRDESLTSVLAEQYLVSSKKPYTKGDIDARAAAIILQDYIEEQHG